MGDASWILVETFGGAPPSVIGLGSAPKKYVPLGNLLRNGATLREVTGAVAESTETLQRVDRAAGDGRARVIAVPLVIGSGRSHGVHVWIGRRNTVPPVRDRAGAWQFNLTTSTSTRSGDLLDLYGVPRENWAAEHAIAGAFTRLVTNRDESEALAKIVRSRPGTEHQAVWTVRRDDGALRAAHFSCRMLEEINDEGEPEILLRGITHDIGEAITTPAAPPPVVLEYSVIEASADDGEYRAIMNLRSLQLLRWMGPPMPGVAWERLAGEPEPQIHPDDLDVALSMSSGLATGRTHGRLRIRGLDGGWMWVEVRAALMALDQHTTAALVTVRAATDA
ncbi:DUF5593 domain-containing protein [Aldersonia sp. NBC_00410]|uniref:GAF domain-containing protein n=1 Tax=Aldersonia sp. NBC_00410 TaxID=2975954 RepID=UPI00224D6EF8|nr:GAF domain-containing protein [Aldersonia sp. NBC_00410]MCX5046676.1 DUF5593 domain-containing protein [Aldersonia sp. NBC_00410]